MTQTRIYAIILASALQLFCGNIQAAQPHRAYFLSPNGLAIPADATTPDCYYWDAVAVRRLRPVTGMAGQTTCIAPDGMKVISYTPQEVHAELLLRRIYGQNSLPAMSRSAARRAQVSHPRDTTPPPVCRRTGVYQYC
jgi:hypothetical protein